MKSACASPLLAAFCLTAFAAVTSVIANPRAEPELCYPAAIQWKPGPASLPAGAQFAVLEGDPTKEGPFTMRLRLPDGYRIPPHMHPAWERVTVISGTFHLGVGEKFAAAATQPMVAGTYGFWPPGMKHFAWTQGETILQLHGIGPWRLEYVDPADDPRNAAKR
jgi:quercetin dioxygenase-like cupin family protein